jgi:excisionase family DNA binding protein
MTDFNPSEWLTTKEAAELSGYDASYVRLLVRRGKVEGRKFGKAWMVNRQSVCEYAEKMKDLGPSKHDPRRIGVRQAKEE